MSGRGVGGSGEVRRTLAMVPRSERGGSFPPTRWSVVVNAGAATEGQARDALEALCRDYWYPLYAFARRHGCSHHDAEDCTQDFLARLLAHDGIARARRESGRFRSYLAAGMANHLRNEWHRAHAQRRGGVPLDFAPAAARYEAEPCDPGQTPEQAFDRTWARELVERCEAELRREYEASGRGGVFAALIPQVAGDGSAAAIATAAAQLGVTVHAATEALHRLRRRLGERLRARVAETVARPADVDAELCQLIAALA